MAGSTWHEMVAGAKAKASHVNDNFDWLTGHLWPMNAGSTTTGVYDLGSDTARWRDIYMTTARKFFLGDANHYISLVTTGQISIFSGGNEQFRIDSDAVQVVGTDLVLAATRKLRLDGLKAGDSFIYEISANNINVVTAGTVTAQFTSNNNVFIPNGDLTLHSTGVINFLGTSASIQFGNSSANRIAMVANDNVTLYLSTAVMYVFKNTTIHPNSDGVRSLGLSSGNDYNIIYYHTLSQDSSQMGKTNILSVTSSTIEANLLPEPKRYERITKPGLQEYGLMAEDCPEDTQSKDKDGKVQGIRTDVLLAYLVGVVKKQETIINEQDARLITQDERLTTLEGA